MVIPCLPAMLIAASADAACPQPAAPDLAASDVRVLERYLTGLDAYAACLRADSVALPPLERMQALETYAAVFPRMQVAVDSWNAAH